MRFCAIVNDFYKFPGSRKYFQAEIISSLLKSVSRKQNFCFREIQSNINFFYQFSDSLKKFQVDLVSSLLKTVHRKQIFCFQGIQNNVNTFYQFSVTKKNFQLVLGETNLFQRASIFLIEINTNSFDLF